MSRAPSNVGAAARASNSVRIACRRSVSSEAFQEGILSARAAGARVYEPALRGRRLREVPLELVPSSFEGARPLATSVSAASTASARTLLVKVGRKLAQHFAVEHSLADLQTIPTGLLSTLVVA